MNLAATRASGLLPGPSSSKTGSAIGSSSWPRHIPRFVRRNAPAKPLTSDFFVEMGRLGHRYQEPTKSFVT